MTCGLAYGSSTAGATRLSIDRAPAEVRRHGVAGHVAPGVVPAPQRPPPMGAAASGREPACARMRGSVCMQQSAAWVVPKHCLLALSTGEAAAVS